MNSSFSHYAISKNNFKNLVDYINSLEDNIIELNSDISSLRDEYKKNINDIKGSYNYKIEELERVHNKNCEDLNSKILNYEQELKKANSLNNNLLRISKERANQERNLRPKKSHSGFIILSRQSLFYKMYSSVKSKSTNFIEFPCVKTRIQTPFSSSLNLDLITDEIVSTFSDFIRDFKVNHWYNYEYLVDQSISKIDNIINSDSEFDNFIFKHCFIANNKSNLWDIEIYTKKDIVN